MLICTLAHHMQDYLDGPCGMCTLFGGCSSPQIKKTLSLIPWKGHGSLQRELVMGLDLGFGSFPQALAFAWEQRFVICV